MRRVIIRKRAEAEFARSARYYNKQSAGLGDRFAVKVFAMCETIAMRPESFPILAENIRRAVMHSFRFVIHFIIEGDKIVILSVFHTSRNPEVLKKRGIRK
jgi:plasmid stabilization system protein ParE